MAATLTTLFAGAINLEQAAVLVIGQNVGTTVKAGLAAIGGGINARRTACAHIIFNLVTGGLALLLLPLFLHLAAMFADQVGGGAAVTLSAFHLIFNGIGVLIFLPLSSRFAHLLETLIRERKPQLAHRLDPTTVTGAEAGLGALRLTLIEMGVAVSRELQTSIAAKQPSVPRVNPANLEAALEQAYCYSRLLKTEESQEDAFQLHVKLLHALSHMDQIVALLKTMDPFLDRNGVAFGKQRASVDFKDTLINFLAQVIAHLNNEPSGEAHLPSLGERFERVANQRAKDKSMILSELARNSLDSEETSSFIEEIKRIEQVCHHLNRLAFYLESNNLAKDHSSQENR